ncbi:helix-turn-helix domain-containing protein [Pseudoalteromonas fenneropenaei]|uniref:Helix-turn-helix domain-containing protein n=1 Tax=Pseudoalteromonas fenneropenaei TaxID=1737459 RepID=A0ABV7CCH7_9GAMM
MNFTALEFALNIATISILLFSGTLLIQRTQQNQSYFPLALCLFSIAVVVSQPTIKELLPAIQITLLFLSLPALLLIAPSFWLYVKGLTQQTPWQFNRAERRHFIPALAGLVVAITANFIPKDIQISLLTTGDERILQDVSAWLKYLTYTLLIATFGLVLGWVAQSAYYLYKMTRRLLRYRAQLEHIFASTEQKELRWLNLLLLLIALVWGGAALNLVLDNLFWTSQFYGPYSSTALLAMVAFVANWGLRQKPGFEDIYDATDALPATDNLAPQTTIKYQRSALTADLATRIALKITDAMTVDKLYLDSALSLPKLAQHIKVSPNYISQTINETLTSNFFDLVNQHRIEAAKTLLTSGDSTVLEIAMQVGYNSKSAFYSAFKKHTGVTPSEFKKAHDLP